VIAVGEQFNEYYHGRSPNLFGLNSGATLATGGWHPDQGSGDGGLCQAGMRARCCRLRPNLQNSDEALVDETQSLLSSHFS